MDNNDNIKPQQTGGLKLMTVFIVVLALHVVVIGGFAVYNLMKTGDTDADLVTTDKVHKDLKSDGSSMADNTQADAATSEKTAPAPTAAPEVTAVSANSPAPAPAQGTPIAGAPTVSKSAPAPAPEEVISPAPSPAANPIASTSASEVVEEATVPANPISSKLAPPPEPTPAPAAPVYTPSAPIASSGPVHMPVPVAPTPVREHVHEQIYVVKITDSYKKIAHAHHVTVAQLKEANHIKGDTLHTGQKLFIPSKTLVAANESATALDATPVFNGSVTGSTALLTSTSAMVPATGLHHHLYTVVKGDTLVKIAHKFKTTTSAITAANGIPHSAKLSVGEKLKIPSSESRSAKISTPAPTEPAQEARSSAPSAELANFAP
jgi:LysM repeat protein